MHLIEIPHAVCGNCGSPEGLERKNQGNLLIFNVICAVCEKEFCLACAKYDYDGNGSSIFCPHCKAELSFPPLLEPENQEDLDLEDEDNDEPFSGESTF